MSALLAVFFGDGAYDLCDTWGRCLLTELVAAAVPIVAALALAATFRVRLSSGTLAALAAMGGFAGYLVLTATCPSIHLLTHTLAVHAGGLVVVTALGAAAALVPTVPSIQSG